MRGRRKSKKGECDGGKSSISALSYCGYVFPLALNLSYPHILPCVLKWKRFLLSSKNDYFFGQCQLHWNKTKQNQVIDIKMHPKTAHMQCTLAHTGGDHCKQLFKKSFNDTLMFFFRARAEIFTFPCLSKAAIWIQQQQKSLVYYSSIFFPIPNHFLYISQFCS